MDSIAATFASPTWWRSVVLVGILINLFPAYLKPRLDRAGASISRQVRSLNTRRRQRFEESASQLRNNPQLLLDSYFKEIRFSAQQRFFLPFAALFISTAMWLPQIGTPSPPLTAAAAICAFLGWFCMQGFASAYGRADSIRRLIERAIEDAPSQAPSSPQSPKSSSELPTQAAPDGT